MKIRSPAVLDANLNESFRLSPVSGSVTLKLIGSGEATLTLPDDAPELHIHDWIAIYNRRGLLGYYRITNIAPNYKKQTDITMLHGIDILSDSVWQEQRDFSGTMAQFITALLNQQTQLVNGVKPWVLGTCASSATIQKSINYDRLSELLEDLVEEGGGYVFQYDMSAFPWTLNYVALEDTVTSEFRITRNIRSATATFNDADLCTRLILSDNVAVKDTDTNTSSTDTVIRVYDNAAAQANWGIVIKTADIDTHDDLANHLYPEADAWAADFLAKRAEPSVQIQIDGDELSAITGDNWDEVDLGRLCRVSLPAYGRTFEERVVSVTYPDLYKDNVGATSHVTVSLANSLPKFSENISSVKKQANKTARSARGLGRYAASSKELTNWSQVVRYQGLALDGTGVTTLYESGIDMDAVGGVTVYSLQEGLQALYAGIQVNTNAITLKVSKGQVSTQLSVECGNVHITGTPGNANLTVDGYVEAEDIYGTSGTLHDIYADTLNADEISVSGDASIMGDTSLYGDLSLPQNSTLSCGYVAAGDLDCTGISINGGTTYTSFVANASVSGNTLTLTKSDGTTVTFNKAASVQISGHWSGRNYIVTATPAQASTPVGIVYDGLVPTGSISKSGKNVSRDFIVYSDDGDGNADSIIMQKTVTINASSVYDDGVAEGEGKFSLATVQLQGASAGTVYLRKTSGSIRIKSTSVTPIGTPIYFKSHSKSDTPSGLWYEMIGSSSGATQTYYTKGTAKTYYESSSSGTYYYLSDGSDNTLFQAGQIVTDTYYTKSST